MPTTSAPKQARSRRNPVLRPSAYTSQTKPKKRERDDTQKIEREAEHAYPYGAPHCLE